MLVSGDVAISLPIKLPPLGRARVYRVEPLWYGEVVQDLRAFIREKHLPPAWTVAMLCPVLPEGWALVAVHEILMKVPRCRTRGRLSLQELGLLYRGFEHAGGTWMGRSLPGLVA